MNCAEMPVDGVGQWENLLSGVLQQGLSTAISTGINFGLQSAIGSPGGGGGGNVRPASVPVASGPPVIYFVNSNPPQPAEPSSPLGLASLDLSNPAILFAGGVLVLVALLR